jgi:hypothetical protein
MERHEACLAQARRELEAAHRTLDITYRLLEEPRVLAVAAGKILSSLTNAMRSVLLYELRMKRIPAFEEEMGTMLRLFKARQVRRYRLKEDYAALIAELYALLEDHRKSPVEFSRSGSLVICSDDFKYRVLSYDFLNTRMEKAKVFIGEAEHMIS